MDMRKAIALVEAGQENTSVDQIVYHGSPNAGIEAFDPAFLGSNTGAKDAARGFYFFAHKKSAEAYLDYDEELKPQIQAKVDRLNQQIDEAKARVREKVAAELSQAGAEPIDPFSGVGVFYLKVPRELRDWARSFAQNDQDYLLVQHYEGIVRDIDGVTENFDHVLNGAIYVCRIRLDAAYDVDMAGRAYTQADNQRLISAARDSGCDGVILRGALDGVAGERDDIFIVFDPAAIEIVDKAVFDHKTVSARYF
jgi:hypothetical protein